MKRKVIVNGTLAGWEPVTVAKPRQPGWVALAKAENLFKHPSDQREGGANCEQKQIKNQAFKGSMHFFQKNA